MNLPRLKTTYLNESGYVVESPETIAELDVRFEQFLQDYLDEKNTCTVKNMSIVDLGSFRAVITWLPQELPEGI